jgi:hypothetical protein
MGLIIQTREAVANYLSSFPIFDDVPIEALKPKEKLSELQNRLNKLKIAGTVFVPRLGASKDDVFGPYFDHIQIEVGFCENRMLNDTGKLVEDLIEAAASILHLWIPDHLSVPLRVADPGIIEIPAETEADKTKRLMAVRLIAAGGLSFNIPKIANVVPTNNAGVISFACATPGVAIFHRTDGKHPNPRVGSGSTLYAGPFNPGPGVTIRARAWLAGYEPSAIAIAAT